MKRLENVDYKLFAAIMLSIYIIGWFLIGQITYTDPFLSSTTNTIRSTVFIATLFLTTIFLFINFYKRYRRVAIFAFLIGILIDFIFEMGMIVAGVRVYSGNFVFTIIWHILFEMNAGIQAFLFFAVALHKMRGWRDDPEL